MWQYFASWVIITCSVMLSTLMIVPPDSQCEYCNNNIQQAMTEYDYSDYYNMRSMAEGVSSPSEAAQLSSCPPSLPPAFLIQSLDVLSSHLDAASSHSKHIVTSLKDARYWDGLMSRQAEQWEEWGDGDNSGLCNNSQIDTIFTVGFSTFVFKGDLYWKLSNDGVVFGYPRRIKDSWPELPTPVDAAFTARDTFKTYFFKGDKVWCYKGYRLEYNYPQNISTIFPGIPNDLDDVVIWGGNAKPYFFKNDKYWRHDTNSRKGGKTVGPMDASEWRNLPNPIDAGFLYTDGFTYFFLDDKYYRYDDSGDKVAVVDPSYPRSTSFYWFGCRNGSLKSDK